MRLLQTCRKQFFVFSSFLPCFLFRYCAEALVLLGRVGDALVHLRPVAATEQPEEFAKSLGSLRPVHETNLVSLLILNGELDQAQAILQVGKKRRRNFFFSCFFTHFFPQFV